MLNKETRLSALLGAIICLLAVVSGAFGSHALADLLAQNGREHVFEIAARYQFYHGLALLIMAILFKDNSSSIAGLKVVIGLMIGGVLIFCGSLYLLAVTNMGWLGAITPIGGTLLIAAWAVLAWNIFKFR